MDRFDRIYALHRVLDGARYPVPRARLESALECSRATVKRIIEGMRLYLGAPITYDRQANGYYYDTREGERPYELPGMWFSADELYALLSSQQLLATVEPGLLTPAIQPLRKRLEDLLASRHFGDVEVASRVRIFTSAARPVDPAKFRTISSALLKRRRLHMLYHGRERDEITERTVSPQRLVYYRDNWYLDAWCHLRRALRSFSVDRIHPVYVDEKTAQQIADRRLDQHFGDAYGIFTGKATKKAEIRFTPEAAKWVADEQWHPQQKLTVHPDGSCTLTIPYDDPRELMREILKHGADAEVIRPAGLRKAVRGQLKAALALYEK